MLSQHNALTFADANSADRGKLVRGASRRRASRRVRGTKSSRRTGPQSRQPSDCKQRRSGRVSVRSARYFAAGRISPDYPREIDAVVHVAGATTATGISLGEMLACNVTGPENVLRYAAWRARKRLIYMSTMSVYGAIRRGVVDESTPISRSRCVRREQVSRRAIAGGGGGEASVGRDPHSRRARARRASCVAADCS